MRLASLKVEKYGNEKMYQLGGKMAEGADDVIATFKGVEVAGDGTVIGKQVGPGKITEWVNKHHAGSSNKINDEIQGIEASLAKGTGNRDADIPPVAKAQFEIEYMLGGTGKNGTKARTINFKQADQKLTEQLNNSPELASKFGMTPGKIKAGDIADYREEYRFTWHELNDVKTIQLVQK